MNCDTSSFDPLDQILAGADLAHDIARAVRGGRSFQLMTLEFEMGAGICRSVFGDPQVAGDGCSVCVGFHTRYREKQRDNPNNRF